MFSRYQFIIELSNILS